ncbi:MAG: NADPH:quinone oxidoreductase family protein [Rhodospirillaceae bacterium]|jgi:NADPH:quinone reductase|nr:NADPH:quinone oxidoreductase family protein [Rhodospirillaceae bacterium]MBT6118297.1 NADPH:quinone oxidoreductase family protein [Rhodospirillaceae bacterium]
MRAVLCTAYEDHDALEVGEAPSRAPGPGEVRIAIHAAGLNFADTLMVEGNYQVKPELPFVPGLEGAGEVIEVGEGVERVKPGDRVAATVEHGAFAEEAVAREIDTYPIPDSMSFEIAAGFPVVYGTSHVGLRRRANLQAGETLLVHGAAGGVGLTAVEIGKALGATVIASAGSAEKLEVARAHGADHLVNHRNEDLREAIKGLTGGRGADVIYDPVGGDVFDASLRCIAWEGRLLVVGFASGRIPKAPTNYLLVKNCAAMGVFWGAYRHRDPKVIADAMAELLAWYEAGKLKPLVSQTYDLAEAGTAMADMRARRSTGKLVVTTGRG